MTQRTTMLIADDSPIQRIMLKKLFGNVYPILEAVNGAEALNIIKSRNDIAVILLDLHMPDVDGFAVLRHLKENQLEYDIPVIVISSDAIEENEIRSFQLGALDFVVNPYNPEILIQRVKSVIQKHELDLMRIEGLRLQEQQQAQEILDYHAAHDSLTGIYNRNTFYNETASMLQNNRHIKYAIVCWDIERFKVINELFGTETGDMLLRGIAEEIREHLACNGTYGRLEADHFAVCIPVHSLDPEIFIKNLDNKYKQFNLNYTITSNIGIYIIDAPDISVNLMCDRASMALHTVKGNYVKRFAYYDNALRDTILTEQQLCSEMHDALNNKHFKIYFQPIYSSNSFSPVSAEALVRWHHPKRGIIFPNSFIPLFERNGFITKLDSYIWEEVCSLLHKLMEAGQKVIPISVNVSQMDFYNPNLYNIFIKLVQKYQIPPQLLKLEITESVYTNTPRQLLDIMKVLQSKGFQILMDDFGSGYSSLNMLKDVPVDILKVDMRFLEGLETSQRAGTVLASIVHMAKCLSMDVVAEGVETQNQLNFLRNLGCDMVQGYYFSKPLPQNDFIDILENQTSQSNTLRSKISEDIDFNAVWTSSKIFNLLFNDIIACIGVYELYNDSLELIRVNEGYYKTFHTRPQDIFTGKQNVLERILPADRKNLLKACKAAEQSSEQQKVILHRLRPDASYDIVAVSILHIGKKTNPSLFYFSMYLTEEPQQITSPKTYLDNTISERVTGIIDTISDGVVELLSGWPPKIQKCNRACAEIFGYKTPKDFLAGIQNNFVNAIIPEDREYLANTAAVCLDSNKDLPYELRIIQSNGSFGWISGTMRMLETSDGSSSLQLVFHSTTQHKKLEDDLKNTTFLCRTLLEKTNFFVFDYSCKNDAITFFFKNSQGNLEKSIIHNCLSGSALEIPVSKDYRKQFFRQIETCRDDPSLVETDIMDIVVNDTVYKCKFSFKNTGSAYSPYNNILVIAQPVETPNIEEISALLPSEDSLPSLQQQELEYLKVSMSGALFVCMYDLETGANETLHRSKTADEYYLHEEYYNTRTMELIHPDDLHYFRESLNFMLLKQAFSAGKRYIKLQCRLKTKKGDWSWVDFSLHLAKHSTTNHLCAFLCTTVTKNVSTLERKASYDAVTNIYNRATVEEKIGEALRLYPQCTFMLFDVDNFKQVNDTLGHLQGDALLKNIAASFKSTFRTTDIIGRIGGDEFVVLFCGALSEASLQILADKSLKCIKDLTENLKLESPVSASIGIARAPADGRDFLSLYRVADKGLYKAKAEGKNRFSYINQIEDIQ